MNEIIWTTKTQGMFKSGKIQRMNYSRNHRSGVRSCGDDVGHTWARRLLPPGNFSTICAVPPPSQRTQSLGPFRKIAIFFRTLFQKFLIYFENDPLRWVEHRRTFHDRPLRIIQTRKYPGERSEPAKFFVVYRTVRFVFEHVERLSRFFFRNSWVWRHLKSLRIWPETCG